MKFNKPKFWDYKKKNLISYLLLPLTIPIIINNFLLKIKSKKKYENIKTICVGNIYLGGTGKTPTSIKLKQILDELKINAVIGKKFYPSQLDEKILIEQKSKLLSGKNRSEIIKSAVINNYDCLIFDDGLQDKSIKYDLEFVCFDIDKWIGNGNLIPSGPLREKISSLKKYDAVFLKKDGNQLEEIRDTIKKINPNIRIFNSQYKILNINKFDFSKNYLIVSGIGNPEGFKKILLNNEFNIIDEIIFPDHYNYKKKDIDYIKQRAKNINAEIVTTEKDYVKIREFENKNIKSIEIDLDIENKMDLINFLKLKLYEKY